MIEIEVNRTNLEKFIENISQSDKEELEYTFKDKYGEKFIEICLKEKNIWFLADKNSTPLAIGGIQYFGKDNLIFGKIWLLSTKNFNKNAIAVLKYVKNKIAFFKTTADVLFNHIYKTNFRFLKLLKKAGFKTKDVNACTKLFYYSKEENFDTRHTTG